MSDPIQPAAKPEMDEFDFAQPVEENPRGKRRSLKPKKVAALKPADGAPAAARELEREAPPLTSGAARPEFKPSPLEDDDAEVNAAVEIKEPAPAKPTPASTTPRTGPRISSTSTPSSSPHGTRPATLYYSTGPRKETPAAQPTPTPTPAPTPMKSTTSVHTAPSTSAPKASPVSTTSSPRPTSAVDYRANVERQSREQKSVGGVLSILVYVLIGFFVLGASLAGYGAYIVSVQLHQQSVTVTGLDNKYDAAVKDLNLKLATTVDALTMAQTQITKQQDIITKQQDTISKLVTASQDNAAAIRTERQTRADETASLRAKVRNLEYQPPTTRKY